MARFRTSYINRKILQFGNQVDVVLTTKWLLLSALIGVVAGLVSLLFAFCLDLFLHHSLTELIGYTFPIPAGESSNPTTIFNLSESFKIERPWLLLIIPALGAFLAGWISNKWAKESSGSGTDAVIESYHEQKGRIRKRVPIIKFIASLLTVGTGGSAGREGPIAQICGGMASSLASVFKLTEKERKIMLVAGMGAGISAIFQSPIGGAIYASEVLYKRDIESESLMPSIISSIISYSVFSSISGWKTVFKFEAVRFENPIELPLYIILSILLTLFAILYSKLFKHVKQSFFDKLMIKEQLKPIIGALILGGIAIVFPAVLESSYGYLQQGLNGNLTIWFMLTLAFLKAIATALTVKSGASGGVFAPTIVVGGLLGGAFGIGIESVFPGLINDPNGYILVGMAAFFASVEKVPIASTIMITEMSGSYELLVPLIFASAISFIGTQKWSLYRAQLNTKADSASYRGEFVNEAMDKVKVRTAFRPVKDMPLLSLNDDIDHILKAFIKSELLVLPVKNNAGFIVGLISLADIRLLLQEDYSKLFVAADIMSEKLVLHLNDSISKAFEYFKKSNYPEIPVLAHGSEKVVIGTLTERNFLIAYERSMNTNY